MLEFGWRREREWYFTYLICGVWSCDSLATNFFQTHLILYTTNSLMATISVSRGFRCSLHFTLLPSFSLVPNWHSNFFHYTTPPAWSTVRHQFQPSPSPRLSLSKTLICYMPSKAKFYYYILWTESIFFILTLCF